MHATVTQEVKLIEKVKLMEEVRLVAGCGCAAVQYRLVAGCMRSIGRLRTGVSRCYSSF